MATVRLGIENNPIIFSIGAFLSPGTKVAITVKKTIMQQKNRQNPRLKLDTTYSSDKIFIFDRNMRGRREGDVSVHNHVQFNNSFFLIKLIISICTFA